MAGCPKWVVWQRELRQGMSKSCASRNNGLSIMTAKVVIARILEEPQTWKAVTTFAMRILTEKEVAEREGGGSGSAPAAGLERQKGGERRRRGQRGEGDGSIPRRGDIVGEQMGMQNHGKKKKCNQRKLLYEHWTAPIMHTLFQKKGVGANGFLSRTERTEGIPPRSAVSLTHALADDRGAVTFERNAE